MPLHIIDVETKSLKILISKLKCLKTTKAVQSGGAYREDKDLSQVWINTDWNTDQLDDWLYKYAHPANYIGSCPMPVCRVCGSANNCDLCHP